MTTRTEAGGRNGISGLVCFLFAAAQEGVWLEFGESTHMHTNILLFFGCAPPVVATRYNIKLIMYYYNASGSEFC